MPAPVISFINMKGGVGKTTLCVGMAEYLSNNMDKKVLVIDIDPQFNATQSLMGHYQRVDEYIDYFSNENKTIRRIFELPNSIMVNKEKVEKDDVVISLTENLSIILGDINIIFDTSNESVRVKMLGNFIEDSGVKDDFDFIFIDSPPTISLFTDTALLASDYYLTPVKIDHYSVLGANSLSSVINNIKVNHRKDIINIGYVYTNTDLNPTEKTLIIKKEFEAHDNFVNSYFFEKKT